MSGGYWDYKNNRLAQEIFGWHMSVDYGEDGFSQAQQARRIDPLEDRELSEMLWDMLCILYSYDYYKSGDTSEETYMKDLKYFKNKWFKRTDENRLAAMKEDLKEYYDELIKEMDKFQNTNRE